MKKTFILMLVCLLFVSVPATALAVTRNPGAKDSAGNYFFSGANVKIEEMPFLGGYGVGFDVDVQGTKATNSLCLGGCLVSLASAQVDGDLALLGLDVDVYKTQVKGNMATAAYKVKIDEGTKLNACYAFAYDFEFRGQANNIKVVGDEVRIAGTVNGDVYIKADNVIIEKTARINGALTINSSNMAKIDSGAYIKEKHEKKVSYLESPFVKVAKAKDDGANAAKENVEEGEDELGTSPVLEMIGLEVKDYLFWTVAMMLVGLVMCWLFHNSINTAATLIRKKTGAMLATGAIAFLVAPVAVIALAISHVGLPASGFILNVYIVAICVSAAFTSTAITRVFLPKLNPFITMVIGVAAVELLEKIPYVGKAVSLACIIFTFGYILQNLWNNRLKRAPKTDNQKND